MPGKHMEHVKGGKKMKKLLSLFVSSLLLVTLIPTAAFAETPVNLTTQNGRLLISEAGTYTLTGSMRGTVLVNPGQGDVTLIMDNITIDGGESAGIAAVSGDSLTVILADGTVNQVQDGGQDTLYNAAIFCSVPTRFEGNGRLNVTGNNQFGIRGQNADLTFASGTYRIQGKANSVETNTRLSVLNANVIDMNANRAMNATPLMTVQNSGSGSMNLWEEPDQTAPSIAQYANGTQVTVLESQGDWSKVQVNRHTGYMLNKYLTPVQGQSVASIAPAQTASADAQRAFNPVSQPIDMNQYEQSAQQQTDSIMTVPQDTAETQTAFNPAAPSDVMAPSKMPDQQQNQSWNQSAESRPQMPGNMNGQQPGAMTGNMPGGMMPGGGLTSTVENPGEIVTSTAVNTAADLEADLENAEYITVTEDNSQVKISDAGTYVVTGSSSDGNITVKKGSTGVVLVLDDLDLTSTTGATLAVNKEAQVKLIISGNVTLTDNENPDDENSTDEAIADAFDGAAMKFKANSQVYMTGDGTLTINGNAKNGIKTGDDSSLIVDGGVTVNIKATNDGINGNFDITLLGGNFTIEAGDDAIHADHILTIGDRDGRGPTIRVTGSNEGLEGTVVNMFGGEINITATDDAVNAANKDGLYEGVLGYSVNMTGGSVTLNSMNGDGIDSNGNVNLIGGTASINSVYRGGDAGIDYDGQMYVGEDFQLNNASGVAGPDGMPGGAMNAQMGGAPGEMNGQSATMPGNDPFGRTNAQNGFDQENSGQTAAFNGNQPVFGQNQSFGMQADNENQRPSAPGQMIGNTMQMPGANNTQNAFAPNQNNNGSMPEAPSGQQGIPLLSETNE